MHRPHGKAAVSHVLLLRILSFLMFIRWGTLYDCGDEEVRLGLCQFALIKLLCATANNIVLTEAQKYALLSHRLALDINSMTYVPLTPSEAEKEHYQVTNHMRVVTSIGDSIKSLRSVASSEPLLSEAAFLIMSNQTSFKLADALATVLTGFSINIGDQAELLVSAFFTWARDTTVMKCPDTRPGQLSCYFLVTELFASLFSERAFKPMSQSRPSLSHDHVTTNQQTFQTTFCDTYMHFNHVIKLEEQKVLNRSYLLVLLARGAAAMGANCQPGIDAVYPYLHGGIELDFRNLGFILVQVKKNDDVDPLSRARIFKKMDPFECGLLHKCNKVDGYLPTPLIRIVFALCGNEEKLDHMAYSSEPDGASSLSGGRPCFTSYDFWCSGASAEVLQPVKESPEKWSALVKELDLLKKFYATAEDPDIIHSLHPGTASHPAHFKSWCGPIPTVEQRYPFPGDPRNV
jgi:hypothetical protein